MHTLSRKCRFLPRVEALEPRWAPAVDNVWNPVAGVVAANWDFDDHWSLGHVPRTDERAVFDGNNARDCSLNIAGTTTIDSLYFVGYTGKLFFDGFDAVAPTLHCLAGADLTNNLDPQYTAKLDMGLTGSKLKLGASGSSSQSLLGNFQITGQRGTIELVSGSSLVFETTISSTTSSDFLFGGAASVTATLYTVTFAGNAGITIASGGTLNLQSCPNITVFSREAQSTGSILENSGTFNLLAGSGSFEETLLRLPILNHGTIDIPNQGSLRIVNDSTATAGKSLLMDSGEIVMYGNAWLKADDGYRQTGGTLRTVGISTCTVRIDADSGDIELWGGHVSPGGDAARGSLHFDLGVNNFVRFTNSAGTGGVTYTAQITGNVNQSCDSILAKGRIDLGSQGRLVCTTIGGALQANLQWTLIRTETGIGFADFAAGMASIPTGTTVNGPQLQQGRYRLES